MRDDKRRSNRISNTVGRDRTTNKDNTIIILVLLVGIISSFPAVQALFILNPTDSTTLNDVVVYDNGTRILSPSCTISSWFSNGTSYFNNNKMNSGINSNLINYTLPSQLPANLYGVYNCSSSPASGKWENTEAFLVIYKGISGTGGTGGTAGISFAGSPLDYNFILAIENKTSAEITISPDSLNKLPMTIKNIGRMKSYVILDCGIISGTSSCDNILHFEQGDINVDSGETRTVNLIIEPKELKSGDIINLKIIGIESYTHVTSELSMKINVKKTFSGISTESITGKYLIGPEGKKLSFYKGILTLGIPIILFFSIAIIKIKGKRQWYMTLSGIGIALISMLIIGILVQ